jgi:hypothetical protein
VRKELLIGLVLIPLILIIVSCTGSVEAVEPTAISDLALLPVLKPEPAPEPVQTTSQEQDVLLGSKPLTILETMPTYLQITDLKISPTEVNPGEKILVTANMLNTADIEANYTLELKVNGVTKFTTEVALPAGETVELRVSGGEQVPGTYILDLNGVTEQFVVKELTETLILSSSDPETEVSDQDTSGGCCGGGSSGQSGCGCGGGSSSNSSGQPSGQSSCGCGG